MFGGIFALALIIVLAGYGLGSVQLRIFGVFVAFFFGVGGVPLKVFQHAGLTTRLALVILVGLSVPTLLATFMALTPFWHPVILAIVLGMIVAVLHVRACWEALARLNLARRRPLLLPSGGGWVNLSTGLTAAGTLCWVEATVISGHIEPGVGGFLTQISPLWYIGLLLVLAGIMLAHHKAELFVVIGIVSLIAALTVTPAFAYGMPRIQTAAKHVGFVQLVLSAHYLNRHDGIYQAYSGFFSFIAWICSLAGTKDSMGLAAYWPPIIDLIGLAVLRLFFGVLLRSPYRIYIAMAITFLVDSIGQDYFSPQSVGFVLTFGIYALAIGGGRIGLGPRTRLGLILLISSAVAVTHELSPYVGALVLAVFVIFKQLRPRYIPLLVGLPALAWALLNWSALGGMFSIYNLFSLSNFAPTTTIATAGLQRLPIVGESSDALLVSLVVLIGLAGVAFLAAVTRRPGWEFFSPGYVWAMMIGAGAGLAPLLANPYGNEGIFRAALFAIPWLAALGITAVPRLTRDWVTYATTALLIGLVALYCLSSFGLDNGNAIRQGDVQALDFYSTKASSNGYILDLSYGDTPTGMLVLANGHSVAWSSVVPRTGDRIDPLSTTSAGQLALNYLTYVDGLKDNGNTSQLYAIWSPAAVNYAVDYGLESAVTAQAWGKALLSSPEWALVYQADGTYLFQLKM